MNRLIARLLLIAVLCTALAGAAPRPAAAQASEGWQAEFYANPHLIGAPALTRIDGLIDFQWGTGTPIQYGSLQPGDLVFFQNTYTVGLSHVGMYIGNDQFIHAENETTGVRISSLTSTYYSTRYLGARRLA